MFYNVLACVTLFFTACMCFTLPSLASTYTMFLLGKPKHLSIYLPTDLWKLETCENEEKLDLITEPPPPQYLKFDIIRKKNKM